MKAFYIVVVLIVFHSQTKAQTYSLDPANSVSVIAPYEELSIFDIYQINNTDSNIVFGWERISVNLPVGWDYSLCDYPTCYTGIPASGVMDSVGGGFMGFLGVNISPYSIPGQGIVKIYVYDMNFPNNGDTLTWIINSSPVGITENNTPLVTVYPNPATEVLFIEQDVNTFSDWKIFGLDGKLISSGLFTSSPNIDVRSLAAGTFLLQLYGEGKISTAKFSKTE